VTFFIAFNDNLRGRAEPITQDGIEDVEVPVGDRPKARSLGSDEF
jgi:hypothetical protein